jgi:hypothetical protein
MFGAFLLSSIDYLKWPPAETVDNRAKTYAQPGQKNSDCATSVTGIEHCNGRGKKIQQSHDNEKYLTDFFNSRDLEAQEGMWVAAYALVAISFVQMIVGSIALWFIRETLKTSMDTANAAVRTAEAAESAERAFVFVRVLFDEHPARQGVQILKVEVSNFGRTPARRLHYSGKVFDPKTKTEESINGVIDFLGSTEEKILWEKHRRKGSSKDRIYVFHVQVWSYYDVFNEMRKSPNIHYFVTDNHTIRSIETDAS